LTSRKVILVDIYLSVKLFTLQYLGCYTSWSGCVSKFKSRIHNVWRKF